MISDLDCGWWMSTAPTVRRLVHFRFWIACPLCGQLETTMPYVLPEALRQREALDQELKRVRNLRDGAEKAFRANARQE
jgi:hypothetical protein